MNTTIEQRATTEIVDPAATTFDEMGDGYDAIEHDAFDSLMQRYWSRRTELQRIAEFMEHQGNAGLLGLFVRGNIVDRHSQGLTERELASLFELEGAIKALDAQFWREALNLTDILSLLPAKRRNDWSQQVYDMKTPAFNEANLRATMQEMFLSRKDYFAERVDGIFRALSHTHATNRPEGFSKRLITYVSRDMEFLLPSNTAYLDDLRYVIAVMLKRERPSLNFDGSLYGLLDWINRNREHTGEWFDVDGGAFQLKLFKKGTVHIDIHPSVAWQLNRVLAHLYPLAIPAQFRTPKKERKSVSITPLTKPIAKAVLSRLFDIAQRMKKHSKAFSLRGMLLTSDKFLRSEVHSVLTAIGGSAEREGHYVFDYEPHDVIMGIVYSGSLPEARSHQFYPTPELLAKHTASLLDTQDGDRILEPSAGTGNLASCLPMGQVTCVEYAPLHCDILRSKGFEDVHCADFLEWEARHHRSFDRILMNPPFTAKQAEAHLDAALSCLAPGGKLVAILPAGMAKRWKPCPLQRATVAWEPTMHDVFPGVSVSITVAVVSKLA